MPRVTHEHGSRTRATLGGLSILIAVAFVVQASAGLGEWKTAGGRPLLHEQGVRQVAQSPVRHVVRVVRRQSERPAVAVERTSPTSAIRTASAPAAAAQAAPRRQPVWHIDLPPPAC